MSDKKLYYGIEGQERLMESHEEVIDYILSDIENIAELEFPIQVYEYTPRIIHVKSNIEKYAKYIIDDLLENLDDEYGDPEGDLSEPSENMMNAALTLAKIIADEYHVWQCERTNNILSFYENDIERNIKDV